MKKTFLFITSFLTILVIIQACSKDKAHTDTDSKLYSEITTGGFTYYQNGNLLAGVSPSPHGSFRLRFNSVAFEALDNTDELTTGHTFPDGSLIVKEIYVGNDPRFYSVMKKEPINAYAGGGWIWAEYESDGTVLVSSGKKGNECTGCHGGSPNRDLTRTFDLH